MKEVASKQKIECKVLFLIFMMIMISPSTFIFGTNENSTYTIIPVVFIASLLLFLVINTRISKNNITQKFLYYIAGVIALSALTMLVNFDFKGGYIVNIVYFVIGFLFVLYIPFHSFVVYYERVLFIIALYSVVMMVLYLLLGFLPFPIITNSEGYIHYNAILSTLPCDNPTLGARLYGPFREPGVFQIFLNIALAFHIYLNKRITPFHGTIYIVAILLTFSTTGYIVLLGILSSWGLSSIKANHNQKFYLIIFFGVFIALVTQTDLFTSESQAFLKFSEGEDNASTASRLGSIWGNIDIFLHNPITGVGYTNIGEMFRNYCMTHYGVGFSYSNTNTILYQFASMGLFYGLLWLIPFYRFFSNLGMTKAASYILGISIMLSFMGENMMENIIVYIFIGYGIVYSNKRLLPYK